MRLLGNEGGSVPYSQLLVRLNCPQRSLGYGVYRPLLCGGGVTSDRAASVAAPEGRDGRTSDRAMEWTVAE